MFNSSHLLTSHTQTFPSLEVGLHIQIWISAGFHKGKSCLVHFSSSFKIFEVIFWNDYGLSRLLKRRIFLKCIPREDPNSFSTLFQKFDGSLSWLRFPPTLSPLSLVSLLIIYWNYFLFITKNKQKISSI